MTSDTTIPAVRAKQRIANIPDNIAIKSTPLLFII